MSGLVVTVRVPRRTSYAFGQEASVDSCMFTSTKDWASKCTLLYEDASGWRQLILSGISVRKHRPQTFKISKDFAENYLIYAGDCLWMECDSPDVTLEYRLTLRS
jgi:hypothetical protein